MPFNLIDSTELTLEASSAMPLDGLNFEVERTLLKEAPKNVSVKYFRKKVPEGSFENVPLTFNEYGVAQLLFPKNVNADKIVVQSFAIDPTSSFLTFKSVRPLTRRLCDRI